MATFPRASVDVVEAGAPELIAEARELFLEYANSLNFSLCFQNFDDEVKSLPGAYGPPGGRLLLGYVGGGERREGSKSDSAGCIALRPLDDRICEMKRLYVRPAFRGAGVGRALVDAIIAEARQIGYKSMRLDTVASSMQEAIAIYQRRGFRQIPAYCVNPNEGVLYLELSL